MKKAILLLLACLLASCDKSSPAEVSQSDEAPSLYINDVLHFIDCIKNETADGGIADGAYKDFINKKRFLKP